MLKKIYRWKKDRVKKTFSSSFSSVLDIKTRSYCKCSICLCIITFSIRSHTVSVKRNCTLKEYTVTFLPFKNVLICIKYVLNFDYTLYCPHYLICHCSNLYHISNNNYNNNYSFVTFICLRYFFAANSSSLCLSHNYSLFCSQPFRKLNT